MKTLADYQEFVRKAESFRPGHIDQNALLGLFGEAGEVCEEFKKMYRDDRSEFPDEKRRERILNELGDVCYYVAALCVNLETSMGQLIERNVCNVNAKLQANANSQNSEN